MGWEWMAPVLAFAGGAFGAWLTSREAGRETRQRELAGRREEWGRRFTVALDDFTSEESRRRELGRVVLVHLSASGLATDEERELADLVLDESARLDPDGDDVTRRRSVLVEKPVYFEDNDGESKGGS